MKTFLYSQYHLPAYVNGRLTVQNAGGSVGRVGFSIRGGRMNFILSWLFRIHTEQALRQEGENKVSFNDTL